MLSRYGVFAFLEILGELLEGSPTGDCETWRRVTGKNSLPDLTSSGVLLLDFKSKRLNRANLKTSSAAFYY